MSLYATVFERNGNEAYALRRGKTSSRSVGVNRKKSTREQLYEGDWQRNEELASVKEVQSHQPEESLFASLSSSSPEELLSMNSRRRLTAS